MQLIANIFITFAIYLLVSVSIILIYSTIKTILLSHASLITLGPYIYYSLHNQYDYNIYISILFTIVLSGAIGAFLFHFIYMPLYKKAYSYFVLLISSIGIYAIISNLIILIWNNDTKIMVSGPINVGHLLFGAYISTIQIIIIIVSTVIFAGINILYFKTKYGCQIRAITSNVQLAAIFGINTNKLTFRAFAISSGLAAIAGILVAYDTGLNPTMGFNILLYGVVAMIIGGVGSMWGLVGGALLLATAQHLGAYYIGNQWMDVIAYMILILFLIWKPLGFSGQRLKKTEI